MDRILSSPSRLNKKLQNNLIPCSDRDPSYYNYIFKNVNSLCADTETRLKELSTVVSPKRSYGRYQAKSTYSYTPSYRPSQQSRLIRYNSGIVNSVFPDYSKIEKGKLIDQFCNLSELAMDKIIKLNCINDALLSKLNSYENKYQISPQKPKARDLSTSEKKLNTLYHSVERLERDQTDCKRQIDTLFSTKNNYIQTDTNSLMTTSRNYISPRMNETELSLTKQELNQKSRDYSIAETNCEEKIRKLKEKISDLEFEVEHLKTSQTEPNKYLFN